MTTDAAGLVPLTPAELRATGGELGPPPGSTAVLLGAIVEWFRSL